MNNNTNEKTINSSNLGFTTLSFASPIMLDNDYSINEDTSKQIKTDQPDGFVSVTTNPYTDKEMLTITAFKVNFLSDDKHGIYIIDDLQDYLSSDAKAKLTTINKNLVWPNMAVSVKKNDLFSNNGILVANGFFNVIPIPLPWHTDNSTGSISLINWNKESLAGNTWDVTSITAPKKGYFYHHAEEFKIDGVKGLLTARSNYTPSEKAKNINSQLVFLTPQENKAKPWNEQVIAENFADIDFSIANLNGQDVVFAAEFNNKQLSMLAYNKTTGKWDHRVIDNTLGPLYDAKVVDWGNKNQVLLVTNHSNDKDLSGVYAYDISYDKEGQPQFEKHILYTGFITKKGVGQASPNQAIAFQPKQGENGKPYILVDGDGAGNSLVLVPQQKSNDDNWDYTPIEIYKHFGNTTGKLDVGYDSNNNAILFVPDYEDKTVHVFRMEENKY